MFVCVMAFSSSTMLNTPSQYRCNEILGLLKNNKTIQSAGTAHFGKRKCHVSRGKALYLMASCPHCTSGGDTSRKTLSPRSSRAQLPKSITWLRFGPSVKFTTSFRACENRLDHREVERWRGWDAIFEGVYASQGFILTFKWRIMRFCVVFLYIIIQNFRWRPIWTEFNMM